MLFQAYFDLLRRHVDTDKEKAMTFAEEANKIAIELNDSLMMVRARLAIGTINSQMGNMRRAINDFEWILPVAERNNYPSYLMYALNTYANTLQNLGRFDKALEIHFRSLRLREKQGDPTLIAVAFGNIGQCYLNLRDYDNAWVYTKESYDIKMASNLNFDFPITLANLGTIQRHRGNAADAMSWLTLAIDSCRGGCSNKVMQVTHYELGSAYLELKEFDKGENALNASLDIAVRTKDSYAESETLGALTRLRLKQGRHDEAILLADRGFDLAMAGDYKALLLTHYDNYARIHFAKGDHRRASEYQQKYIDLNNEVFHGELVRNISRVLTDYEEAENLATIAAKQRDIERQQQLAIAMGTIAVLAAILIWVLFRNNAVIRKVNNALAEAKMTIEDQNKKLEERVVDRTRELFQANDSLKKVNEELDNFIYKTSHDLRGPLVSLRGIVNVAFMDVKDPLAVEYFKKLDLTAGKLNTILTRLLIINQINSSAIKDEEIMLSGLIDEIIGIEHKKGLPPRLKILKEVDESLSIRTDGDLIRIILENLVDNSVKFSNESPRIEPFVTIRAVRDNGRVHVSVTDNGVGISSAERKKIFHMFSRASEKSEIGGVGLYLAKIATEKLGGEINVRNTKEGFTEFYADFPVVRTAPEPASGSQS
jgi:signal transduction histidine kinase